ncbi:hypothetical protein ILUMI_08432 [Ignelater luminosus]|uniref:Uncharacterized protein n=1 Tax=Ignelater luminosus TaxID=2038154 RepID=A0A8K0D7L7_IGNLU|nr:hypothetical protein ILUMI_08432 [Ignelater luminosus]
MYLKICLGLFVYIFLFTNSECRVVTTPRSSTVLNTVNTPVVSISKSKEMTASMQLNAVDAFKQAYAHLSSSGDRCSIVRQIFTEKYPDYKWQVAMYKSYSIQSIKSIDIKVNDDKYILFATKK